MVWFLQFIRSAALGFSAGCVALFLDEILAVLTLGHAIPVSGLYTALYGLTGAALAILIAGSVSLRGRPPHAATLFSAALAGVYLVPVLERLNYTLNGLLALAAFAIAILGYLIWIALLKRIAGSDPWYPALLLGALTAALGLVVNRNLVAFPFEPVAILADVLVVVAVMVLGGLVRWQGARQVLSLLVVSAVSSSAIVIWAAQPGSPEPQSELDRPHLLMLSIDTLRQDVFRSVLDETAEGQAFRDAMIGSAFFSNTIASAPWTVPSVASIMTGLYPQEHGLKYRGGSDRSRPLNRLATPIPTLAQHLGEVGYRTEAIVANPILIPESGIFRGFENYSILAGPTTKLPLLTAFVGAGWLRRELYLNASSVRRKLVQRIGDLASAREPIFLWLHLMDPHKPLHGHSDLSPDPSASDLPENDRLYREETRYALREMTLMIEILERYGFWQNALVVVVSDHGEMFLSDEHRGPEFRGKVETEGHGHALYDELVRVPLVIRPPGGLSESREVESLASHVDLRDTIVDVLGLPLSPFPGRYSLAPFLVESMPESDGRESVLVGGIQSGPKQRGLRTEKYKLIHFPKAEEADELYDIGEDPLERNDLASSHPEVLARFLRSLNEQWKLLAEAPPSDAVDLDEETRERLKALGYL